ncbi:hypothetical protein V5R04_10785 [Jonesiaceae bacterium BS-20]|uniref:Uncharacterized protein n=1 Tax=Jonesiaceae bacterium BS-20 TaxID=3120821 RepID=A0AAU7DTC9_9MICO
MTTNLRNQELIHTGTRSPLSWSILRGGVGLLIVGGVIGGAVSSAYPVQQEAQASSGLGYFVELSPEEQVTALFNTEIFAGKVTSIGQPIRVTERTPEGTIVEAVYTPVDVLVSESFRGSTSSEQTVRLRFLGGTAEGLTFTYPDSIPLAEVLVGEEVFVFSGAIEQAGDEPIAALTPNSILITKGDTLVSPFHDGSDKQAVDRDEFLEILRSEG